MFKRPTIASAGATVQDEPRVLAEEDCGSHPDQEIHPEHDARQLVKHCYGLLRNSSHTAASSVLYAVDEGQHGPNVLQSVV